MPKLFLICACALVLSLPAAAQQPGGDPIERHLIAPEIVMQNQRALGITADQRQRIIAAVTEAQQTFSGRQWELQAQMEKLAELLATRGSSKRETLDQLDQVLAIEAQIKKTQISLLIDMREILTPEQYERALQMKRAAQGSGGP